MKFKDLMTEHERRVNDGQILAYQQGDNSKESTSLVTGIGQNYAKIQQKHIKRELPTGLEPAQDKPKSINRSQLSIAGELNMAKALNIPIGFGSKPQA